MPKIAIGAGHGLNTPGKRTPDGAKEWTFNNKVVTAAIRFLHEYQGVEVLRMDDPTGKTDVPLTTRTNKANDWGADILISCHHNANTGKWGNWTGTETYTYIGKWSQAEKLADLVHRQVVQAYQLKNRGLKKANFHMLRESRMPAILIEGAFMDSTIDIKRMKNQQVLEQVGKAIATGVEQYFGLKKKPSTSVKPSDETFQLKQALPGYLTAADAKSGKNKKVTVQPGTYYIFNKANGMVNLTTKVGTPGSWINPNITPPSSFLIKVKADTLWYYDRPDWNAKKSTVRKGEVFTVVDTLTVNGSKMYKLKSGNYMTANPNYVEKLS
ncbi:N-acetylmuramoyl-L-alanine amidase [Bacillus sp. J14TS2]|uniref:N-acetylmuramoyl-L-alanine amidase n=1 Tax=Bacillus sp. J14TS2 TaxID=2807188 RepID=UPI001B1060FF|nr:N-acetylmuramoyl-L-alanine amidase [Bacillus sp. J14TS2]GIN74932.1 N-acetylmuramoyl-L-alanine amidase [Bacillus sp. J14TS2]